MSDTLTQPLRMGSVSVLEPVQRRTRRFASESPLDAELPLTDELEQTLDPEIEPSPGETVSPGSPAAVDPLPDLDQLPVSVRERKGRKDHRPETKEAGFPRAAVAADFHYGAKRGRVPRIEARVDGSTVEGVPSRVDALIDRIVCAEQEVVSALKHRRPIFEAYLQESVLGNAGKPAAGVDHYLAGRLSFADGPDLETFWSSASFRVPRKDPSAAVRQRRWLGFGIRRAALSPGGFARMIAPDFENFNTKAYRFSYVRRELLGMAGCVVVDVSPRQPTIAARFIGRLWIEDRDGCIVRFTGTFRSSKSSAVFFHFDSWRFQAAARLWFPAFTYIEDRGSGQGSLPHRLSGHVRLWGYNQPQDLLTEGAEESVGHPPRSLGPLESQYRWQRCAEGNLIARLEQSGLLAAQGEVDQLLNTVVQNLLIEQDPPVEVRCRVLLTTPLETLAIGQSILISRGLLDVLPDEAGLAMVLSDELSHVLLGHPTDTMFAFADRLMFPDREIAQRLRLQRKPAEMEAAHRKALELLSRSPYADKMTTAGLFLKTLRRRAPQLPNLIRATLGNQLTTEEDLVRLGELAKKTPELKTARGEQVAALPLGSRIDLDPWSNNIRMLEGRPLVARKAADDAHFGVFPLMSDLRSSR